MIEFNIQLYLVVLSLLITFSIIYISGVERAQSTVHNWVHKVDLQSEENRNPEDVAVDEAVIQLNDERYWLYATIDPEANELPHKTLETTITNGIAHSFFHRLREKHDADAVCLADGVKSPERRLRLPEPRSQKRTPRKSDQH